MTNLANNPENVKQRLDAIYARENEAAQRLAYAREFEPDTEEEELAQQKFNKLCYCRMKLENELGVERWRNIEWPAPRSEGLNWKNDKITAYWRASLLPRGVINKRTDRKTKVTVRHEQE